MNRKILVVDDNYLNIKLLTEILEDENYLVYSLQNGLEVVKTAVELKPDVILLDIMMPELDGFEICELLKKEEETKGIVVIMVTAKIDGRDIKKALEIGAFDYIKKPIDEIEVVARLQSAIRFKEHEDNLIKMAMKDSLTGLYNHDTLIELFKKEFKRQERSKGNISFIMFDIDYFKRINDNFGHLAGDLILKEFSQILSSSIRSCDIVGRYGGEEFSLILADISYNEVVNFCQRLRKKIETQIFSIDGKDLSITISIGLYYKVFEDNIRCTEMMQKADEALYKAKGNGRNRLEISSK